MQPRREVEQSAGNLTRESFGELLGQLANNSGALVRDEIELAKQEMREKVISLRSAIIVVSVAAAIAFVSVLALTAAAIIGLATYVGPGNSSLIIGAALALAAGITASIGIARLRRTNLTPQKTLRTLEEDKEWLKELM